MGKKQADNTSKVAPPPLRRRQHHRPVQFVVLSVNIIVIVACFIGSAALVYGQNFLENNQKTAQLAAPAITTAHTTVGPPIATTPSSDGIGSGDTAVTSVATSTAGDSGETTAATLFPDADPNARNFLITGADNNACDDPNSATQVGDRGTLGERSDTIMIMRVDPSTNRAAVLSFPRDLYVKIDGTNSKNRINSAYSKDNPQRLINTIANNFQIKVDHYIQIDFCAFKRLVDAVGGVSVPFALPSRDAHTNLNIPTAGCFTFNGSTALAYVRSRHLQTLNPKTGKWVEDPASDYGRISRQQDFLRRAAAKVINSGFSLSVAQALIDVAKTNVVTDPDLTLHLQLQFAGVLKALNPSAIQTYQIDGVGTVVGGADVIQPRIDTPNMKAVLAIFRGEAQLATAPPATSEPTSSAVAATATTAKSSATITATTLPPTAATEVVRGVTPPKDVTCP